MPPQIKKILLPTIVLISLLLSLPSFAVNQNQKAAELNQMAVESLNSNKYLRAIDLFERARELAPDNDTIRENLAIAYNNYAIALNQKNDLDTVKEYFYKAIELEPKIKQYKENLANSIYPKAEQLFKDGDYETATLNLREILKLVPNHTPGLILKGHIHYNKQEFDQTKKYWEEAHKNDPSNSDLRKLLSKLDKEEKIENNLKKLDAYRFDIRFDKKVVDSEIYDIRSYLQEAYREVGRNFNYYPKRKIPVILYTEEDFDTLRRTPSWVAGIFDGKIRLPVKKNTLGETEIKRLIWHEYTHAIVLELAGSTCPSWFNEGLAKWEEAKVSPPDLTPLKEAIQNNRLIPLTEIESSFSLNAHPDRVNLAYLEAYSFIEFILYRWNFYVVRGILNQFKNGKSTEEAFSSELYRSIDRLDSDWREFIQKRYCQ